MIELPFSLSEFAKQSKTVAALVREREIVLEITINADRVNQEPFYEVRLLGIADNKLIDCFVSIREIATPEGFITAWVETPVTGHDVGICIKAINNRQFNQCYNEPVDDFFGKVTTNWTLRPSVLVLMANADFWDVYARMSEQPWTYLIDAYPEGRARLDDWRKSQAVQNHLEAVAEEAADFWTDKIRNNALGTSGDEMIDLLTTSVSKSKLPPLDREVLQDFRKKLKAFVLQGMKNRNRMVLRSDYGAVTELADFIIEENFLFLKDYFPMKTTYFLKFDDGLPALLLDGVES